eukprot:scaffold43232_cov48-Phaeocystis_antarctica.AAC.3
MGQRESAADAGGAGAYDDHIQPRPCDRLVTHPSVRLGSRAGRLGPDAVVRVDGGVDERAVVVELDLVRGNLARRPLGLAVKAAHDRAAVPPAGRVLAALDTRANLKA